MWSVKEQKNLESTMSQRPREAYFQWKRLYQSLSHLRNGISQFSPSSLPVLSKEENKLRNICESHKTQLVTMKVTLVLQHV